jgi:hypothetical protein
MWQEMAAWLPKAASSIGGLRVRTEAKKFA